MWFNLDRIRLQGTISHSCPGLHGKHRSGNDRVICWWVAIQQLGG